MSDHRTYYVIDNGTGKIEGQKSTDFNLLKGKARAAAKAKPGVIFSIVEEIERVQGVVEVEEQSLRRIAPTPLALVYSGDIRWAEESDPNQLTLPGHPWDKPEDQGGD